MPTHLEQELENIKSKVFEMADIAIEAIARSIDSLKKSDVRLAEEVLQRDAELDQLEIAVDEEC
nr:phosphate transport system regulator PhoU [Spirochaetota bacterium]